MKIHGFRRYTLLESIDRFSQPFTYLGEFSYTEDNKDNGEYDK